MSDADLQALPADMLDSVNEARGRLIQAQLQASFSVILSSDLDKLDHALVPAKDERMLFILLQGHGRPCVPCFTTQEKLDRARRFMPFADARETIPVDRARLMSLLADGWAICVDVEPTGDGRFRGGWILAARWPTAG